MDNNLIPFKESIFTRIRKAFIAFFTGSRFEKIEEQTVETASEISILKEQAQPATMQVEETDEKDESKSNIIVETDPEKRRIIELRKKYDNNEITSKDISLEDMDKIIELYNEDTEKINADIRRRKDNIARMLRELKQKHMVQN